MKTAPMRVGIVGSRDFTDADQILDIITSFPPGTVIVSGGAAGADTIAAACAERCGLAVEIHPALWDKHGKRAGFMRNRVIVANVDRVIAFFGPSGITPGTYSTVRLALEARVPVACLFQRQPGTVIHD
jgi:predicted Rossmann fold nucleotide-binding protein DprA/Smf involved in DNA uptake